MRPLGVPTVADRALQRSASQVLSAIYEQDFLFCSFGGRPGRGAHQALATLREDCGRKDRVGVGGGPQEFLCARS
jgi:RNA-directed DNA polymerase